MSLPMEVRPARGIRVPEKVFNWISSQQDADPVKIKGQIRVKGEPIAFYGPAQTLEGLMDVTNTMVAYSGGYSADDRTVRLDAVTSIEISMVGRVFFKFKVGEVSPPYFRKLVKHAATQLKE